MKVFNLDINNQKPFILLANTLCELLILYQLVDTRTVMNCT